MKQLAQNLVWAIAMFGVAAALSALGLIVLAGESPTSDDAYVLGVAVGVVVSGALFLRLLCEQFLGKKTAAWVYGGVYALLLLYTVYVMQTAELHGPGLALLVFGTSVICACAEFFLIRRLPLVYVGSVGSALAATVLALLFATQR